MSETDELRARGESEGETIGAARADPAAGSQVWDYWRPWWEQPTRARWIVRAVRALPVSCGLKGANELMLSSVQPRRS